MRRFWLASLALLIATVCAGQISGPMFPGPGMPSGVVTYTAWNPSDKSSALTLSGSNLIATHSGASGAGGNVRSVKSNSSGKWYYELTYTNHVSDQDDLTFGVGSSAQSVNTSYVGSDAASWGILHNHTGTNINKRNNSTNTLLTTTGTWVTGDVFMVAWDAGAQKLWFGRNGTWFDAGAGAGNPSSGTNETFASVTGTLFIMAGSLRQNDVFTLNAGASAFSFTKPTGFSGWSS